MKKTNNLNLCHGGAYVDAPKNFFGDELVVISGMTQTVPPKGRTFTHCLTKFGSYLTVGFVAGAVFKAIFK